ncbi:hypothetical protein BSIN_0785 [Burkholderia singularis]|uniref:Uncharacterized protein n=1 Tax=Burkholderia singularis TaxID=1503053 RepID=A0A238H9W7_9BURK|nr:hypothetical protein BSIN_0785 [Burkholderia singularis]
MAPSARRRTRRPIAAGMVDRPATMPARRHVIVREARRSGRTRCKADMKRPPRLLRSPRLQRAVSSSPSTEFVSGRRMAVRRRLTWQAF